MVVEKWVISREKQGSASWSQVLIVSKGIAYYSWLVSLLGEGDVVVYIASTIMRGDTVDLQDMKIMHYDIMFGVMKDVLDGLWDAGLCLIKGACAFVVEYTTCMVTASI